MSATVTGRLTIVFGDSNAFNSFLTGISGRTDVSLVSQDSGSLTVVIDLSISG